MIILQLSAGQGPIECCRALGLALRQIEKECAAQSITLTIIEAVVANKKGCFKSILLQLESNNEEIAKHFATAWQGSILWICQSYYRPRHKRKNWFFSGQMYEVNETEFEHEISYQTCRASGAGGQHVNTTDSAVRAVHKGSGISVRVESERSQHANKRLAKALLFQKLESVKLQQQSQQDQERWQQHWDVQRGNPVKVFKGEKFLFQ